jgi:predicted MarR family transcription regulator
VENPPLTPLIGSPNLAAGVTVATCKDRYMSLDPMSASLTRFELALMRVYQAFASWALELQKYVSGEQFSFQEVALLHCVRLRGGTTTLAEMMLFLHRQDLAALNYSLRKLEKHGLIKRARGPQRREVAYALTELGRRVTDAYGEMRQRVLIELCHNVVDMQRNASQAAAVIERLIGIYDQAAQAVLNQSLIAAATNQANLDEFAADVIVDRPQDERAGDGSQRAPLSAARAQRLGANTSRRGRKR